MRVPLLAPLLLILLLACPEVPLLAQQAAAVSPQERLVMVSAALRQLDFKGVFSFEQGGRQSSLQWVHAVRDGVERERLLGLDGGHREVLRERPVGCMLRSERAMHGYLMNSLRAKGSIDNLSAHYQFAWGEPVQVAGRSSDTILIQARDGFRFGYRLLVDQQTAFLLGADLINEKQSVLESFRFLNVQIGNVDDAELSPVTAEPMRIDMSDCVQAETQQSTPSQWQFDLPPGFALCSHEARAVANEQVAEDVQTYTDGLNHFTVFVRRQSEAGRVDGSPAQLQHGNTLLAQETVEIRGERHIVTVVGEIPDATARRVIGSIHRVGQPKN